MRSDQEPAITSLVNEVGRLRKLDSVWDHGDFLGVKGKTGEIVIGARSGIFKARTVRRRSTEDRWNPKAMELVTGVPWRASEDDDKVDGGSNPQA